MFECGIIRLTARHACGIMRDYKRISRESFMTNPDNIVRTRARNGGRASVYEANGWAQSFTSGIIDGNGVIQNNVADMNVLVGGSTTKPDVVLAENPVGYKVALDLVTQQAVTITKPASNSRISAIVAYTDDLSLPTTEDTVTGSPSSCGLIVVNGTAGSSPSAPSDTTIRNAITADGATGSQAAYCVIATVLVASNTTSITNNEITNNMAKLGAKNIDFATIGGSYSTSEIATGATWVDGKTIYKKSFSTTSGPQDGSTKRFAHEIANLGTVIKADGFIYNSAASQYWAIPTSFGSEGWASIRVDFENIYLNNSGIAMAQKPCVITIYYTKAS